jgi:hypothetical protein
MKAGDGKVRRFPGGLWSENRNWQPKFAAIDFVSGRTIAALEKAGVLVRCHEFPEEWRDTRRLSD